MLKKIVPQLLTALFKSLGILPLSLLQIIGVCAKLFPMPLAPRFAQQYLAMDS
jgi:hypothetical protein